MVVFLPPCLPPPVVPPVGLVLVVVGVVDWVVAGEVVELLLDPPAENAQSRASVATAMLATASTRLVGGRFARTGIPRSSSRRTNHSSRSRSDSWLAGRSVS